MKFTEFKNSQSALDVSPVYLFEGEETYLHKEALNYLISSLNIDINLNYATFNGEDFSEGEFLSSLTAYPFLGNNRLTVIKEFYPKQDLAKKVLDLTRDSVNVLAIFNQKSCDSLSKSKQVSIVDCKHQDGASINKIIVDECSRLGVKIEYSASRLLAEYCLNDLTRIMLELNKLSCYVEQNGNITETAVKELVSKDTDYKIYEITNYIGKKDFANALQVVNELLSRGETPQRIIINLYYYFRKILFIKISDKTDAETSRLLGFTSDYPYQKTKQQSKLFNVKTVKKIIDGLAYADYKAKNGELDGGQAMWNSLFSISIE